MHLKSLTLRGFKSFASATTLRFEPGITCVVGPNGSGKSNVVDALSWVMGEQGAKNLRGGKMDDVIFAGTSKRQALGRAEVTLTIDNTDGAIPVDYTEVTISRTLFRTGGSEYAVNGTPARLLDIQELLNDSGLGKEMHVIVGQGRLDAILHADPIERRSFIEEAAGVLKHRRRKDKAVRKLTGLQTNLDRLSDLRTELNRQLGPLGRQAEAAQKAATVQATLRDSTARLLADDTVRLQSSLASTASAGGEDGGDRISDLEHRRSRTEERLQEIESRLGTLDSELEYLRTAESRTQTQIVRAKGIAQRAEDKRAHLLSEVASLGRRESKSPEELRSQAEHHREELGTAETAVEESAAALDRSQMRKEELALALKKADDEVKAAQLAITEAIKNRSALQSKSSQARERISDLTARIEANRTEIDTASARIAERREELATAEAAVEGVEAGESELDTEYESANEAATSLETELEGLRAQKAKTASELASAQARAEALSLGTALEADLEDILNADLPGVGSAVTERLSVATGFEMAVAAALSNTVSGVLVDSGQVALTVLDHLGEDTNVHLTIPAGAGSRGGAAGKSSAGKGANPTAETMAKSRALPTLTGSADGKSTVRWLTEVVSSDVPELTQLLNAALETVVCVDDAGSALSVIDSHPELTAVTIHGEIVTATRVSRARTASGTRLASQTALEETQASISELQTAHSGVETDIDRVAAKLTEAKTVAAAALEKLHSSDAAIMAAGEEVSRITSDITTAQTRLQRAKDNEVELATRLETAERDARTAESALAGAGDVEEVVDTTDRDELSRQVSQSSEDVIETRISHKAATDRARFLSDRVDSLLRQAAAEESAREQTQRTIARKKRSAASAVLIVETAQNATALAETTVTELASQIQVLVEERGQMREEKGHLGEELGTTRTELQRLKDAAAEAELAKERFRLKLEEIENRAGEETGLSLERLVELYGPHTPVPAFGEDEEERPYVRAEVEKRHKQATAALKRIGTVNPLALEEYEALKERHQFLEKQITDIETSRKDLMKLVDEVDRHVERVFAEAYADTAREFEDIFSRLFPGGEGSLSLTDPDDMLTTGVDVHARPAGKKVKRLSLLSGGERSLVAVAMLVAIFKARPSPFYVMDEVEAALDDLNLSRLLTVFEELQDSSQLIVITHQKRTMEIADALYGVTMHGDGVSKVISQRIP
ncbi:chromosome segregation protein SMC [Brevibacterium aurantiacum]|uniref:Chromosome partition protein Smc n=1 Tax=Brevibacterium aurantiacum TaxID=273384 RepID=A0A2H1JPJ6_BREAU|nr:chromosome segregation protein SMC [Brevibacterium aurantiacum]AZL06357.1 chromosome segregation protein SMC [Brevibacterium aurantiacum]AZL13568.1 chromosome segregation protein SMC [Brevibacterium aurantiacum]AZT97878.1 chromosome segregation protein SMC [Brevibacterium aurantiacum]MDN5737522.1 chromosome segregation protein SMC [Brevibacterium aurantiacum]RCS92015.1 chromosome segregation protein SMC [Brevibacterium aurantiacum]